MHGLLHSPFLANTRTYMQTYKHAIFLYSKEPHAKFTRQSTRLFCIFSVVVNFKREWLGGGHVNYSVSVSISDLIV